ncbi:MAG: hypothetical protein J0H24_24595, partial [Delftia acidovorans]|nr:hypothetical protein [Delftia acidovorans]
MKNLRIGLRLGGGFTILLLIMLLISVTSIVSMGHMARSTTEYEQGIETDLAWLGLTWDERYNQSKRFDRYEAAIAQL